LRSMYLGGVPIFRCKNIATVDCQSK